MDDAFTAALADWNAFFAFAGGAAATLLGLLFVALSLRLDIFRRQEVADVRDFAAFTFASFLTALVVAGLALAPHQHARSLALPLLVLGGVGVVVAIFLAREWIRLNPGSEPTHPGPNPDNWQGWIFIAMITSPAPGLALVALLLWQGHAEALFGLALVEGLLLVTATISAWIMFSRARPGQDG
jgi:hypothetical protein